MAFLGWYMSGGPQKGKCGYAEIFKIQNTPAACGKHVAVLSFKFNWKTEMEESLPLRAADSLLWEVSAPADLSI